MNKRTVAAWGLGLIVLTTGCVSPPATRGVATVPATTTSTTSTPTASPERPPATYPMTLNDFGQYDRFPATVAGYRRGHVTAFEPDLNDYSIGYDRTDTEMQQAVTLYFYPRLGPDQAAVEESEIMKAHAGAIVRSRREITLQGRSGVFNATLVTMEYAQQFEGREQRVSSQLMIILQPDRSFKVRSTSPVEQAKAAEAGVIRLVEGVAWVP